MRAPLAEEVGYEKISLAVTIQGKNIGEISSMSIEDLSLFFDNLRLTKMEQDISEQILKKSGKD